MYENSEGATASLPHDADVHEQGCGNGGWKRLNFCENGSTLKKEARYGSKLGSD